MAKTLSDIIMVRIRIIRIIGREIRVYICVYMYVCVYVYVCTAFSVTICSYIHILIHLYILIYIYIYLYTYIQTPINMRAKKNEIQVIAQFENNMTENVSVY